MKKELCDIIDELDFNKVRVHPNILIAARLWEDDRYNAAEVCYKFMRIIDDMIDNRKADNDIITCMEKQVLTEKVINWISCLNNMQTSDSAVTEVIRTVNTFRIPLQLFHNFAGSMIYDINNQGFETFKDFLSYAEGASVAPASVFVHLCCLKNENGEYIPPSYDVVEVARPCAIFSYLVHIIRDFQKDQHNNLNYFALDILKKNNLHPPDLRKIADGGSVTDDFRNVIKEYWSYAEYYRIKITEIIDEVGSTLEPRYLLSLKTIYNLYLQVFERIDISNGNFTTVELNPSLAEIKERVLEVINRDSSL